MSLYKQIKENIVQSREFNSFCKSNIQKLTNIIENTFTNRAILLDKNLLLFEQNNKKATRKSIRAIIVSSIKVISYKDIVKAQKQHDIKEVITKVT